MKNEMTQEEFDARWPVEKPLHWWSTVAFGDFESVYARERAHAIAEREKELDGGLLKPEAAGEFWTRGVAEDLIHNGYLFRPRMRGPGTVTLKGSFVGQTNSKAEAQALVEAHMAEQEREEPEAPAQGERPKVERKWVGERSNAEAIRWLTPLADELDHLADRADAQDKALFKMQEKLDTMELDLGGFLDELGNNCATTKALEKRLKALEAQAKPEPVSEPCGLVDWAGVNQDLCNYLEEKAGLMLPLIHAGRIMEIVKSHLSKEGGE